MLICGCPPCPFSPLSPVVAELRQANLITPEEYRLIHVHDRGLLSLQQRYEIDVVNVQSGKFPKVMSKTAEVLRRHGFKKESKLLAGRQSRPSSICLCYVVQCNLLII